MIRSETVEKIAPAFLQAQKQMNVAVKSAKNDHFKSRYSDFASVVEAVKGPLNENGISYLQPVRMTGGGVEVETLLMHESGEFYSETLLVPVQQNHAQGVGSAITYGKRYGLQSLCGLPSDDDDGNAAAGAPPVDWGSKLATFLHQKCACETKAQADAVIAFVSDGKWATLAAAKKNGLQAYELVLAEAARTEPSEWLTHAMETAK